MIESWFQEYGAWSWMVLGLVLLIVEIVATGTFFLWFGIAALFVGLLTFALGGLAFWGLQTQLIVFVILSIVLVIAGRQLMANRKIDDSDNLELNQRAKQNIGREALLVEAISQGVGRIKLGDTIWRVKGKDAPVGAKVKVVGEDGATMLLVELS